MSASRSPVWKTPRVPIREIRPEGIEIVADQSTPWVRELLFQAAPNQLQGDAERWQWVDQSEVDLNFRLSRLPSGNDFLLEGELKGQVLADCARCGDAFSSARMAPLRLFLHHSLREDGESGDDFEDLDYREFSSQFVDLIDILSEQLVLAEPLVDCPARKDDGSCVLCHRNPQSSARKAGQVTENRTNSPFADLDKLKLR